MQRPAPIALFAYQRLPELQRTVSALQRNTLAGDSDLFIFSDAPKNEAAAERVRSVRAYLATISGFRSVTILEREKNLGLSASVIDGVRSLVDTHGSVIVVEDDLETSPYFLSFLNRALNVYANDERVISVHGYCYPVRTALPESFFLRGADCWGWGTWKRGWDLFEADGTILLQELSAKKLSREFDFDGTFPYTKMLKKQIAGQNDSWAVRWYASAFLHNKMTLYPGRTLVKNISSDVFGTHTGALAEYHSEFAEQDPVVGNIPVIESMPAREAFKDFFRRLHVPLWRRAASLLHLPV